MLQSRKGQHKLWGRKREGRMARERQGERNEERTKKGNEKGTEERNNDIIGKVHLVQGKAKEH